MYLDGLTWIQKHSVHFVWFSSFLILDICQRHMLCYHVFMVYSPLVFVFLTCVFATFVYFAQYLIYKSSHLLEIRMVIQFLAIEASIVSGLGNFS